jgi:hypothetical protein
MFDVGAPTHSSTDNEIGFEYVSNARRDRFMTDRETPQFQLQHGLCLDHGVGVQQDFEMADQDHAFGPLR